jgi:PKD repeat protein
MFPLNEKEKAMRAKCLVLATAALMIAYFLLSCTRDTGLNESTGLVGLSEMRKSMLDLPPSPLNGRDNPLIAYIRTNWTNGDQEKTGGLHYGHIKIYGMLWSDLENATPTIASDNAEFIADHFDMYLWGGHIVGEHFYPQFPSALWMCGTAGEPTIGSVWDSTTTMNWVNSAQNEGGYTWDDLVMHYKYDNTNDHGTFLGWNAADDTTGDGCRDMGPSDPTRTATCILESEACDSTLFRAGQSSRRWNGTMLSPAMPGYPGTLDMTTDRLLNEYNAYTPKFMGTFFDCVSSNVYGRNGGLRYTFEYEGSNEQAAGMQHSFDKVFFLPNFTVAFDQKNATPLVVYMGNIAQSTYSCNTSDPNCMKEWGLEYMENFLDECWIMTNTSSGLLHMEDIQTALDCPFLDYCGGGKGYVFAAEDVNPNDRGKRFTLATFYMINHQMAFYYYRTHGHGVQGSTEHIEDWQWNPYVEFDVGQPAVNELGLLDFQGNAETNLYFIFAQNSNYKILGREYLRSDDLRVLVLTKVMASGKTEGADPTTVNLPHCYQAVQPDLSLGPAIDQITLYNNDGVILVRTGCTVPPVANFSGQPRSGSSAPMTVYFTDLSTNNPTSWYWQFGDGTHSYVQNPSHAYNDTGNYTVTLTATNAGGSDSETKTAYISIGQGGGGKGEPIEE